MKQAQSRIVWSSEGHNFPFAIISIPMYHNLQG